MCDAPVIRAGTSSPPNVQSANQGSKLSARSSSLEEAFFQLTEGSTEYSASYEANYGTNYPLRSMS
jgi:hypothetical protein